ncbi:hypothetical protein EDC01DRAFT_750071 [Geopyxis carbonaria]|nr:hypothetical protein EDC01DRAFT_750071 [Geopyxis carbonaria]
MGPDLSSSPSTPALSDVSTADSTLGFLSDGLDGPLSSAIRSGIPVPSYVRGNRKRRSKRLRGLSPGADDTPSPPSTQQSSVSPLGSPQLPVTSPGLSPSLSTAPPLVGQLDSLDGTDYSYGPADLPMGEIDIASLNNLDDASLLLLDSPSLSPIRMSPAVPSEPEIQPEDEQSSQARVDHKRKRNPSEESVDNPQVKVVKRRSLRFIEPPVRVDHKRKRKPSDSPEPEVYKGRNKLLKRLLN